MNRFLLAMMILAGSGLLQALAQEGEKSPAQPINAQLDPGEMGFRYDDNIFRSVSQDRRLGDEIYSLNLGGNLNAKFGAFRGSLGYHLGADQYVYYSTQNNTRNDFNLYLLAEPGEFNFYYEKDYFIRNSQDFNFDYTDDGNLFGTQWLPGGPWNYEARYKLFNRHYYSTEPAVRMRNFEDNSVFLGIQREINDRFSVKLRGSYNNRQFNRNAISQSGVILIDLGTRQTDETWSALVNAHVYFESILQDLNYEIQRTHSNSHGFSNTVQSVSWAAVIRPATTLYLQLFFRLYSKSYDQTPIRMPGLQMGFVNEDSQDLLSVKATWEWAHQWSSSISLSRARNESTQPEEYYIKNILTLQVKRNF
jgi:hypothetical protein